MNSPFSAVLLAGGKSTRMGYDKALVAIDGVPLWKRQLRVVERLTPTEIFLAGPPRGRRELARYTVVPDVVPDAGPLAGLVAGLRQCRASHLLALGVDLPQMTAPFLKRLLARRTIDAGVMPMHERHFEPVAAIYPRNCLAAAEETLQRGELSLQKFAARGVAEGWLIQWLVSPEEAPLFLNMNTPDDLAAVVRHHG